MSSRLETFLLEPIRYRNFGLWLFRVSQLLHERTNGAFDEFFIRWSRHFSPPNSLGAPKLIDAESTASVVAELVRDGCSVLPKRLPDQMTEEIVAFAKATPAYAYDPSEEIHIDFEAIPRNTARHYWPVAKLLRVPAVQGLLLDPTFCVVAQSYLRVKPILTSATLWLDAPSDKPLEAHQYHYDNDGPGFLKFFFYLTDVYPDTGAHCFLRGTHSRRKPQPFRQSKIYPQDELYEYFGREKEVMFAAPRGTIIAEDTAGFHRGSNVVRAHRLLMQFQFSVIDIPLEEELKGLLSPVEVDFIPQPLRPTLAKLLVSRAEKLS